MKTLKWSLVVALVTGVGVSTVMLRTPSPRPLATDVNERNQEVARNQTAVYQSSPLRTVPVRKLARAVPLTPDKTDAPAADITS